MATLGHEFKYEGSSTDLPFASVDLELLLSSYYYQPRSHVEGEIISIERDRRDRNIIHQQHKLSSGTYQIHVPSNYFFTPDEQSLVNLWEALKDIISYRYPDSSPLPFQISDLIYALTIKVAKNNQTLHEKSIEALILFPLATKEYLVIHNDLRSNPRDRTAYKPLLDYLINNQLLIHKNNFNLLHNNLKNLLHGNYESTITSEQLTYILIAFFVILKNTKPFFRTDIETSHFKDYLVRFNKHGDHISNDFINSIIELFKISFDSLFNFPIDCPVIELIKPSGVIEFISENNQQASYTDLINYSLTLEKIHNEAGATDIITEYRWLNFTSDNIDDNILNFDFYLKNNFYLLKENDFNIKITLRLTDNTLIKSQLFQGKDKYGLENIKFQLPLYKKKANDTDTIAPSQTNKKLRGKVIELSGKCNLSALTIVLRAKATNVNTQDYKVIGSSVTDEEGNFIMSYPFGIFTEAQALVSLAPDEPVSIDIYNDQEHISKRQTINDSFLFILLKDLDCSSINNKDIKKDSSHKTPRLPEQEDLINSGEFSQDLGAGSCVNLTKPNRTLNELTYYAVVRVSEPDVAHYTLEKTVVSDKNNPLDFDKNKTSFNLGYGTRIERKSVDLNNPIRWQDSSESTENISLYQTVQVAHGHILQYKTIWKADGYSLGDLLYSLALGPGEK